MCVCVCVLATGIQSSLIMNTLIWNSGEGEDNPPCINGVYFPSIVLESFINSSCCSYLSLIPRLWPPPRLFFIYTFWLIFAPNAHLLSLFTCMNYKWRRHQTRKNEGEFQTCAGETLKRLKVQWKYKNLSRSAFIFTFFSSLLYFLLCSFLTLNCILVVV